MQIHYFFTVFFCIFGLLCEGLFASVSFEIETLPNGLRVAWAINSDLPLIDFTFVDQVGFRDDPVGKSGLADLLAATLDRSRPVAQKVEALGASKTVSVDDDFLHVSVHGLASDASELFSLLTQLIQLDLSEAEFKTEKARRVESWKASFQSPDAWASWVHQRFLTSHTPYGRGSVLTLHEYEGLKFSDLQQFYEKSRIPSHCILLVNGAGNRVALKAQILATLGVMPSRASSAQRSKHDYVDARFRGGGSRVVKVIDVPGSNQAQVRMGVLAPSVTSQESYAFEIANAMTGAYFNSRLNRTVRDKLGLTYGIQSNVIHAKDLSELIVSAITRSESAGILFQKTLEVIETLRDGVISEVELAEAKKYLLGRYALLHSVEGSVSGRWLAGVLLGLPASHIQDYELAIRNVSLEQVKAVTKKYFQFQNGSVVVAGDAKLIQKSFDASEQKWRIQIIPSKSFSL